MEKILDLIGSEVVKAFQANGYDEKYGKATLSIKIDQIRLAFF